METLKNVETLKILPTHMRSNILGTVSGAAVMSTKKSVISTFFLIILSAHFFLIIITLVHTL